MVDRGGEAAPERSTRADRRRHDESGWWIEVEKPLPEKRKPALETVILKTDLNSTPAA